jgi:16S rRNA processing protein RimM
VSEPPRFIAVGRITHAHGVKGEVSVLPLSQVEGRFQPGARLFLSESQERSVTVNASRPHHQRLLVSFRDVADRSRAEELRGEYLFVPASESPPLPEGEFWAHELIGCRAVTGSGRELGEVTEVVHTQANDVWVVVGEEGEVLIPALASVVESVDVTGRLIVVREIAGLTAP